MKITKLKSDISPSRSDIVSNVIKSANTVLTSELSKFLNNAQPMKVRWYHINQTMSVYGKGYKDSAGPYDGGIKYDVIHNYVCYGFSSDRGVDVEEGNNVRINFKPNNLTFIHLPNTLEPLPNDRLSLEYEDHKYLYKVLSSVPTTFNNKAYIKTEVALDDISPIGFGLDKFKENGLIVKELNYIEANAGTDKKAFITENEENTITSLQAYKQEILNQFNDYFYNDDKNVYLTHDSVRDGFLCYMPLLVDLQMEFRTLWTYDVNTILDHETLVNKRTKYSYNKHIVRRFLNKIQGSYEALINEGITFSGYYYLPDINQPMYKVQSYFNDSGNYYIFDYYYGDNVFYDDNGKAVGIITSKEIVDIPDGLKPLLEKYSTDTLDTEWLIKFLDEYDFEMGISSMLMAFIIMTIIDKTLQTITHKGPSVGIF